MIRVLAVGGVLVVLAAIAAALIPMWTMSAGIGISGHGAAAVVLMIVFCFAVGGGLMFLIFYSARHGYDDEAHQGRNALDELDDRADRR